MPSEAELWARQSSERSKAFSLFCMYRDMGPERSLDKLRKSMGEASVSQRNLELYSARYNWVKRAQAYDDYLQKKALQTFENRILKFKDQRTREALEIADRAFENMQTGEIGSKEARKRWELGVDKFMQILGLDKQKLELSGEVKTGPDVAKLKEVLKTLPIEKRIEFSEQLDESE